MNQKDIPFGTLPIGAKFYDYYYSGDYCIKVSDDIVKEFLCWYDNGMRDRRDLDRIYDKASDLFGDQ